MVKHSHKVRIVNNYHYLFAQFKKKQYLCAEFGFLRTFAYKKPHKSAKNTSRIIKNIIQNESIRIDQQTLRRGRRKR